MGKKLCSETQQGRLSTVRQKKRQAPRKIHAHASTADAKKYKWIKLVDEPSNYSSRLPTRLMRTAEGKDGKAGATRANSTLLARTSAKRGHNTRSRS